jgi:hypothetical protein
MGGITSSHGDANRGHKAWALAGVLAGIVLILLA